MHFLVLCIHRVLEYAVVDFNKHISYMILGFPMIVIFRW